MTTDFIYPFSAEEFANELLATTLLRAQVRLTGDIFSVQAFLERVSHARNRFEQVREFDQHAFWLAPDKGEEGPSQYVWVVYRDVGGVTKWADVYTYDNILNLSSDVASDIRLGVTPLYRTFDTKFRGVGNDPDRYTSIANALLYRRQQWAQKTEVIRNLSSNAKL